MGKCCIICYRSFDEECSAGVNLVTTKGKKSCQDDIIKRFFELLRRHLSNEGITGRTSGDFISERQLEDISKLLECDALGGCEDCLKVVEAFCEDYHLMKKMELRVNWRLWNLGNIMASAGKASSGVRCLRDTLIGKINIPKMNAGKESNDIIINSFIEMKSELIKNCSETLLSSYPKVVVTPYTIGNSAVKPKFVTGAETEDFTFDTSCQQSDLDFNVDDDQNVSFDYGIPSVPSIDPEYNLDIKVLAQDAIQNDCNNETIVSPGMSSKITQKVGNRRLLRKLHRCARCQKTFKSLDRLRNHQKTVCLPIEWSDDENSESDKEEMKKKKRKIEEEDYILGVDASSEEDAEDDDADDHNEKKVANSGGRFMGANNFLRVKCPNCLVLFLSLEELLLHYTQCDNATAKIDTIIVDLLSFPSNRIPSHTEQLNHLDSEMFKDSEICAKVKVSTFVSFCDVEKCAKPFYRAEDLENHKRLHEANFICQFCPVEKNYAPNLALHELEEHAHKETKETINNNSKRELNPFIFICPRCEKPFSRKQTYIDHHISAHLSIALVEQRCLICKLSDRDKLNHYKTYHNIINLEAIEQGDILSCNAENCQAYFRKTAQLMRHQKLQHSDSSNARNNVKDNNIEDTATCHFPKVISLNKRPRKNASPQFKKERMNKKPNTAIFLRFECPSPECTEVFDHLTNLLFHFETEESHLTEMDTLKVKVVSLYRNTLTPSGYQATIEVPKQVFLCSVQNCRMTFISEENLKMHQALHKTIKCNFCDFEDSYAPDLANHELDHFKPTKNKATRKKGSINFKFNQKCPRCDYVANSKEEYISHHSKEHLSLSFPPNEDVICPICNFHFPDSETSRKMITHFQKLHNLQSSKEETPVNRCKVDGCRAYFLTQVQLSRHTRKIHKDEPNLVELVADVSQLKCQDCQKIFYTRYYLRKHRLKMHNISERNDIIKCSFNNCSEVFETEKEFKNHKLTHSTNSRIECPKCHKIYPVNGFGMHLNSHERREKMAAGLLEPSKVKQYVCEQCGKVFKGKTFYTRHLLHHAGPDSWQFQCSICSKKCVSKEHLQEHMQVHSTEKRFVCQICGEKYAYRQGLKHHVKRRHTNIAI